MRAYVVHDIAGRAVKAVAVTRNGLGVLDDPVVCLRHPFGQATHALQLFFKNDPSKSVITDAHIS